MPSKPPGLGTDSRAATLDEAKAEFEASWKQWKAWAEVEEIGDSRGTPPRGDRRAGSLDPDFARGWEKDQGPPNNAAQAVPGTALVLACSICMLSRAQWYRDQAALALQKGHETRSPNLGRAMTTLCANGSGSPSKPNGSRPSSGRRQQNASRAGIERAS